MNDFVKLVEGNQEECKRQLSGVPSGWSRISFVLLARTPFRTDQSSSPALMPTWFPELGGQEKLVYIEDLEFRARVELNDPEVDLPGVHQKLWEFEEALLGRLTHVFAHDYSRVAALHSRIRKGREAKDADGFARLLEQFRQARDEVGNTTGFRPSIAEGDHLVARLADLWRKTIPERLLEPAKDLAGALALGDESQLRWKQGRFELLPGDSTKLPLVSVFEPYFGVLAGNSGFPFPSHRFARGILATMGVAHQLLNVSAHTDRYGPVPAAMALACGAELRAALGATEDLLRLLPPIGAAARAGVPRALPLTTSRPATLAPAPPTSVPASQPARVPAAVPGAVGRPVPGPGPRPVLRPQAKP